MRSDFHDWMGYYGVAFSIFTRMGGLLWGCIFDIYKNGKFTDKCKISLTNFIISQTSSSDDLQPTTILSNKYFINILSVSYMQMGK